MTTAGTTSKRLDASAATSRIAALAIDAAARAPEAATEASWLAVRARYDERHGRGERRPRALRLLGVGVVAAAALGAFVLMAPRRVTYSVEQGLVAASGFVRPIDGHGARLRFSDGSRVDLEGGARVRVTGTDRHGARVALESGRLAADVVHHRATSWAIDAGPFTIAVVGTRFSARWSDRDEELEVVVREGAVDVRGPLSTAPLVVRAGQRLVARVGGRQVSVLPIDAPPPEPPSSAAPEPNEAPAAVRRRVEPRAARAAFDAEWGQRVGSGEFASVLADVDAIGADRALARASRRGLAAIADAARFGRRAELARRAHAEQRRRYPGTPEARDAAFLLGRLAEDVDGARAEALRWYDVYLRESPDGPYVGEAMGRKLVAVSALEGREAAQPLAREYLRRHPSGPYARAARELLGTR